jgi:uncharacterized coiled-coil protein SlyX
MTDNLVKRMRNGDEFEKVMSADAAADRIEDLEAKLAEQIEWVKRLADDLIAAEDREARLKAKLAKAVAALDELNVGDGWAAQIARTTLAELKEKTPDR